MKNKYILFNNLLCNLLQQSNPVDYKGKPFIELTCRAVFTDDFFLKLTWSGERLEWYRTTWLRKEDNKLVNNFFDNFDEECQSLTLNFLKEEGIAPANLLDVILKKINTITIKPILFNEKDGRDGEGITLKMGRDDFFVTVLWETRNTATEWAVLDELLELLHELNKNLIASKSQQVCVYYNLEEKQDGFEQMLVVDKKR